MITVFSLTLARSPMASRSYRRASDFLNYSPGLASDLLAEWKSGKKEKNYLFLGGLSLHLNHLIESRVTNYDWPFGTLPFGLFGSNLDTRDLETYPRTYSGHFWNMSIFDDSRAV